MLTGISHLEMRVRDLEACRILYGRELGLEELGHGVDPHGERVAVFATGASILELHEDAGAVTSLLPGGGRKDPMDIPGSIGHFALYARDNHEAFSVLQQTMVRNPLTTQDGPSVQPLDHAYMQRSLLEFRDPDGYIIQIADSIDPRAHLRDRLEEKRTGAAAGSPGLLQGFDHVAITCSDVSAARTLFGGQLELEELSHRTETVPAVAGFEEAVFAVGMTDLELAQSASTRGWTLGPGAISAMGLWSDDVVQAYGELGRRGVAVGEPPSLQIPLSGISRRTFTFTGPDGLRLEIAERA